MWKPGSDRPQDKKPQTKSKETDAPMAADGLPAREKKPAPKFSLSQKTLAMKARSAIATIGALLLGECCTNCRKAAVQEQHKQDTWVAAPEEDDDVDSSTIVCIADVPDPSLPLLFGRRSFGGFNKGVEDEFKEASRALRFAASEEKELRDEVSAEEMTERMLKYTGLSRGGGGGGGRNGPGKNRNSSGDSKRSNGNKRQRK
ncbi:hypothetical protein BBJ28_00013506 [Nothophytophthora sp. Chile5]|nr:hypothetical protein BBJ28_00013506 [Nothophytophthora sp. Chile5]